MKWFPSTLRSQLFLSFFALVVLFVVIISGAIYLIQSAGLRAHARVMFSSMADRNKALLQSWLHERKGDLLGQLPYLQRYLEIGEAGAANKEILLTQKRQLKEFLRHYLGHYGYAAVALFDDRGRTVVSAPDLPLPSALNLGLFTRARGTDEVVFTDVHTPSYLNGPVIIFSTRLVREGQEPQLLGVVAVFYDFEKTVEPLVRHFPEMGETGESFLVREEKEGIRVLTPLRLRPDAARKFLLPETPGEVLPARLAVQGKEGIVESLDYRGEPVISAVRYLPFTGWGYIVKQDRREIYASIFDLLLILLVLSGVIIAGGIAVVGLIAKRLSAPLTALVDTMDNVRAGSLDVAMPLSGTQETRSLAHSIERMLESLKEAQEELVRKERLAVLGELAGGVSHELRQPLGVLRNSAYFLNMKREGLDEKTQDHLDIIRLEVERANKIISDLLDFSRVRTPERQRVNLNQIVSDAVERAAVPENVEVRLELEEALPPVPADAGQIGRVLSNLILNAIQSMPEGGELCLRSEAQEGRVEVTVADTGHGIPSDALPKVFEPLFTTKAKGIGLGLAIVKNLIEAHGGTVAVESREGEGSGLTITLPLEVAS